MTEPSIPEPLRTSLERPSEQGAFPWKRVSWSRVEHFAHVAETLDKLPTLIDRESTRIAVQDRIAKDQFAAAFVAVMVWGYGTTGYGPARTERVLTQCREGTSLSPAVEENLRNSMSLATNEGAVAAFRYLNNEGHIPYLGPAYFTKWLYFVTATSGLSDPDAAPILDAQVISWLGNNSELHLKRGLTADYERYIRTLRSWGLAHNLSPAQVEREIFALATGR